LNWQKVTAKNAETRLLRRPEDEEWIKETGKYFEDVIDILSLSTLQQVVSSVYHMEKDESENTSTISTGQDLLRPRNISLLSPRVFWSIWYHYKQIASSMEEALTSLLPNLDWNYLWTSRVREKSEKAKENERQAWEKEKQKRHEGPEQDENEYQALKHISDVENAMEFFLQNNQKRRVSRGGGTAKASADRTTGTFNKTTWTLITPTDLDLDELVECMTEGIDSKKEKRKLEPICQGYALVLSTHCSIRNWRELANVQKVSELYHQFQSAATGDTKEISESQMEQWIEAARMRSMDEIMLEILNGDDDLYFTLREKLQCGTPKDLKLWMNIPSTLVSELGPFLAEVNKSKDAISAEMIHEWCLRAEIALDTCSWLDDYITPLA
jgi:hypothetical protein